MPSNLITHSNTTNIIALTIKLLKNQIIRFAIVGGFTAAIDYIILYLLVEYYDINYLLSTAIGFFVGSSINYILSIIYVFEGGRFRAKGIEFTVFIIFTALGLLLNHLIMWLGVDKIQSSYLLIKIVSLILVTLFNFLTKKYLVFKN